MKSLLFVLVTLFILMNTPTASAQATCPTLPSDTGLVTMTTSIQSTGNYTIWSRVNPPNTSNTSYWLKIDNQCGMSVGGSSALPANTWTWIDYQNGTTTNKINVILTAGDHIIRMIGKESGGVKLDKLLITDDPSCTPTGAGDNCKITTTIAPSSSPTAVPPTNTPQPSATVAPTIQPTNTPIPSPTPRNGKKIKISTKLEAIGTGGNTSPINPSRTVTIELFQTPTSPALATSTGLLTYNTATKSFEGAIELMPVTDGSYLVRMKTPRYFKALMPGFITLDASNTNGEVIVGYGTLYAGDVNGDDVADILDYNIVVDCYSDLLPPKACSDSAKKTSADLDDNGQVNGIDLNLLIRSARTRAGN